MCRSIVCVCVCVYVCMYVCMCRCVCECVCVCVCVCVYRYIYYVCILQFADSLTMIIDMVICRLHKSVARFTQYTLLQYSVTKNNYVCVYKHIT